MHPACRSAHLAPVHSCRAENPQSSRRFGDQRTVRTMRGHSVCVSGPCRGGPAVKVACHPRGAGRRLRPRRSGRAQRKTETGLEARLSLLPEKGYSTGALKLMPCDRPGGVCDRGARHLGALCPPQPLRSLGRDQTSSAEFTTASATAALRRSFSTKVVRPMPSKWAASFLLPPVWSRARRM